MDAKTIKKVYEIRAPASKVWSALVDQKIIDRWGGGPSKMDDSTGTGFTLWGGDIFGKNIEVVKGKKLVQEWYGGKWKKPSIASFTLEPEGEKTRLTLVHTDVPPEEAEDIDAGWDDFYLGCIKNMLEKN